MHKTHPHLFRFFWILMVLNMSSCGIKKSIENRPDISKYNSQIPERKRINDSTFTINQNFLAKNKQGIWELYVEGDPLEIGLISGKLSQELIYKQERVFFDRINNLVPSKGQQKFLRKFLSWYNRKMYHHVPEEYKAEIYGISRFMSTDFNALAAPYLRALYLHGAHDIGHALSDLALVGCTSFAVWDEKTEDGQLLIGRNFDFYAGDAFAEDKLISFVNPDQGYKYMSYSWGGFIGVVSGMNEKGLTVTVNAGKSKIPWVAKTPISIVALEILQYASTLNEAIAIAKNREVFVSEAIMVGSALDHKAVLIEVSPKQIDVFEVENSSALICSNHFQSASYKNDRRNLKTIKNSHSQYRYDRMSDLINRAAQLNPEKAASILRNTNGVADAAIGYGNEKAINQLLAHHGIIFKPEELKVWVSANPYQLGEFVAYDLKTIFQERTTDTLKLALSTPSLNLPEAAFLKTQEYQDYEKYRHLESQIEQHLKDKSDIDEKAVTSLVALNPHYWKAHYLTGLFYYQKKYYSTALPHFEKAASCEITTLPEAEKLSTYIKKTKRKIK